MCDMQKVKRLGIFIFYDASGIVDPYVQKLLKSLLPELDKLVIGVNGKITDDSKRKLEEYSESIFIRENRGFDASGYKEIFLKFMANEDWKQWDEVLLFNDTFYGPVVSWNLVFDKMKEQKNLDFWGLSRYEGDSFCDKGVGYPSHIQSYFLVCRKRLILSSLFWEFWNSFDYTINRREATEQFEIRFTTYFSEKGFTGKAYMDVLDKHIDMEQGCIPYVRYPYELLSELHFPVIKRTAITVDNFKNARRALEYIKNNTDYDTELIYHHLTRLARENRIVVFNPIHLEMFCNEHKRVFIYGNGKIGINLAEFLDYKGWNYEGFLVSEKSDQELDVFIYHNMKFSEDDGIILALGRKAYQEVYPMVKKDLNVSQLFLPY